MRLFQNKKNNFSDGLREKEKLPRHSSLRAAAVVTCRNQGRYLRACLDSLLAQTLPFTEIVLVDDDSSDETFRLWEDHYRGKVLYERGRFGHQMTARNAGILRTKAPLITCIDGDDRVTDDYHEKLVRPFETDPLLGIVYCGQQLEFESESAWFPLEKIGMVPFDLYRLWKTNLMAASSLFRRELWPVQGFRDYGVLMPGGTAFAEDWELWLRRTREGWKAKLVPEKLYYYRIHGTNTSKEIVSNLALRRELLWSIRLKNTFYDQTFFVFLSAPDFSLKEVEKTLRKLKKNSNTQIVLINGVSGCEETERLRALATHYFEIGRPSYAEPLRWKAYVLKHLTFLASSREILILDFHADWPEDIYLKLHEIRLRKKAHIVSSALPGERKNTLPAWRTRKGSLGSGFREVPGGQRACRVFAGPLNALLMDARTFHAFPFEAFEKSGTLKHESFALGYWVWENRRRWFFYDDPSLSAPYPESGFPSSPAEMPASEIREKKIRGFMLYLGGEAPEDEAFTETLRRRETPADFSFYHLLPSRSVVKSWLESGGWAKEVSEAKKGRLHYYRRERAWKFLPGVPIWKWAKKMNARANALSLGLESPQGGDLPVFAVRRPGAVPFLSAEALSPRAVAWPDCRIIFDASTLKFPLLASVFERVDERLDLEAYCEAARLSCWPVLLAGPVSGAFMRRFSDAAKNIPNLFLLVTADAETARDSLVPLMGAGLYLLREPFWRKAVLPEFIRHRMSAGFPVIHTPFAQLPEENAVLTRIELGLQIRKNQEIPRWCLAMERIVPPGTDEAEENAGEFSNRSPGEKLLK